MKVSPFLKRYFSVLLGFFCKRYLSFDLAQISFFSFHNFRWTIILLAQIPFECIQILTTFAYQIFFITKNFKNLYAIFDENVHQNFYVAFFANFFDYSNYEEKLIFTASKSFFLFALNGPLGGRGKAFSHEKYITVSHC